MKAYCGATRSLLQMKSTLPQNVMRSAAFPSLGNLFSPLQYAVRRFTTLGDKERAEERDYINKEETRRLAELRKQFEREVRAIYKESGEKLDQATLEKLIAWKMRDKILHT